MVLLEIKNLKVKANDKEILKGIDLRIKQGEIQALLGPNASGKTSLCHAILGNPKYQITQGKIFFGGKDITKFPPEKRVKLGIALAWQAPPAIKGVKLSQLLEKVSQKRFKISDGRHPPTTLPFFGWAPELLEREINVDFSGGEKKISELLQVLALSPKLVIFDEIDSGLDIKRVGKVAKLIKKEFINKDISVLLITHWGQILKFLTPDITNVIVDGKIICKEKDYGRVLKTIKKYGYEKCKECPFLAK